MLYILTSSQPIKSQRLCIIDNCGHIKNHSWLWKYLVKSSYFVEVRKTFSGDYYNDDDDYVPYSMFSTEASNKTLQGDSHDIKVNDGAGVLNDFNCIIRKLESSIPNLFFKCMK